MWKGQIVGHSCNEITQLCWDRSFYKVEYYLFLNWNTLVCLFANLVGHLASSIQTISNSIRTKIHKTRTTLDTIASTCSLNVHTFQFNRDHKSLASFLLCRKDNTRKSLFENLKVEHQTKDLKVSQSSHLTINDCLKQQLFFRLKSLNFLSVIFVNKRFAPFFRIFSDNFSL